jgi:dTDP-glucose 4,6-dehydratase
LQKELRKRIDIWAGDIRDPFYVQEAARGREVVFHLAALIAIPYSYNAPTSYIQTNVLGTLNVLEACLKARTRKLVHTSTSEVYGTARYIPIDEQHPLQGQSPYSASKIGADHLVESFYRSFNLPAAIMRPFNTFGPRQSARAVIPTILSQLLAGKKEISLGALKPIRDMIYVADTVAGFLAVAESSKSVGEVIHMGSGHGRAIRQIAEAAMRVTGIHIPIRQEKVRLRPHSSEVLRLVASNNKARKLLHWSPKYTLERGLRLTAEYIRSSLENYKTNIYNV